MILNPPPVGVLIGFPRPIQPHNGLSALRYLSRSARIQVSCLRPRSVGAEPCKIVLSRGGRRRRFHSRRKIPTHIQCSAPLRRSIPSKIRGTRALRTSSAQRGGSYRQWNPDSQRFPLAWGHCDIRWIGYICQRVIKSQSRLCQHR